MQKHGTAQPDAEFEIPRSNGHMRRPLRCSPRLADRRHQQPIGSKHLEHRPSPVFTLAGLAGRVLQLH